MAKRWLEDVRDSGSRYRAALRTVGTKAGVRLDTSDYGKGVRLVVPQRFEKENWGSK